MKKCILSLCLVVALLGSALPVYAAAADEADGTQIEYEYFEDGSYIVTVIEDEVSPDAAARVARITSKSKVSTYYSADERALWYVKVTGTFTYGNGSSQCIVSKVTAESYVSNWSISSKSSSCSGSTASATATAVRDATPAGTVATLTRTVTLTCSATGVFS